MSTIALHGRKWRRPTGVQGRSHNGPGQSVSAEACQI